jgi:hypothetical protein
MLLLSAWARHDEIEIDGPSLNMAVNTAGNTSKRLFLSFLFY